jgi:hypothetical protein
MDESRMWQDEKMIMLKLLFLGFVAQWSRSLGDGKHISQPSNQASRKMCEV